MKKHLELITETTHIYRAKIKVQYRRRAIGDSYFNIAKYYVGKNFNGKFLFNKIIACNIKSEQSNIVFSFVVTVQTLSKKGITTIYTKWIVVKAKYTFNL